MSSSESSTNPTSEKHSQVIAWLRLARISALPTAISNILMGYLLAHRSWSPGTDLIVLLLSSSCIYIAGMILNDVFDLKVDSVQRPQRPIPSGQISKRSASFVGAALLLAGIGLAAYVSWENSSGQESWLRWRPAIVATVLAVCVLLYDGLLKRTIFAPLLMGACRLLNVLLGASTIALDRDADGLILGFPMIAWWIALAMAVYVIGITRLARDEASEKQKRLTLITGATTILFGLLGLSFVPNCPNQLLDADQQLLSMYPLLIGLISLPILRRVVVAAGVGSPKSIQQAVVTCLKSIIILDAALCFLIAPDKIVYALLVIGLLIPSMLLSRAVPPT